MDAQHTALHQPAPLNLAHRALLLLGLLAAVALRLGNLGQWSLWYDETVSVYLAQLPLREMLDHTAGDIHPPGYYALLHLWQLLVQPTPAHGLEFLYAWVSVACGVAGMALLYAIGRQIFGATSALVAVWLAAINPFQIWYSQEVRMYTLGALLALLCLWATLLWFRGRGARWLVLYALGAAAGLYTLYYFLFVLVGLGIASLILARTWRRMGGWLLANGAAVLLFSPWWGIFVRQALDPPVPPWRVPWEDVGGMFASLQEALAALLVGQTSTGPLALWALTALAVMLRPLVTAAGSRRMRIAAAGFVAAPLVAIFVGSLVIAPLYHVRYLFPFAAPVLLFAAATLVDLWRRGRIWSVALASLLVVGALLSTWDGWSNPLYARDDHRGAVAQLARAWRPGDVILVNAGWVYTPLAVYWDGGDSAAWAVPPLGSMVRLLPKETLATDMSKGLLVPIVRSGSVDGSSSLGWGEADSDFFAATSAETVAALDQIAADPAVKRIWHYRFYDTVSDPQGLIRSWLDAHTALVSDTAISGRDFGRLELRSLPARSVKTDTSPIAQFGDDLTLLSIDTARADSTAGTTLYATLRFASVDESARPLAASLRLYDAAGNQVAQHDEPLSLPVAPLAVSAEDLPAGEHTLTLVLYDAATGEAFAVNSGWEIKDGQQLVVGRYPIQ